MTDPDLYALGRDETVAELRDINARALASPVTNDAPLAGPHIVAGLIDRVEALEQERDALRGALRLAGLAVLRELDVELADATEASK